MTTRDLADIPLADQSDGAAPPTAALRELNLPSSRRSVLRGITLSALTVGAVSLTWGPWRSTAMAESGPDRLQGWDRNDCKDAYPEGYAEERDTSGLYRSRPGACFGGEMISSEFCANGWYRSDEVRTGNKVIKYTPVSGYCGGSGNKNAWQWRTPDGRVYRCSDGNMAVTVNGQTRNVFSICRAQV